MMLMMVMMMVTVMVMVMVMVMLTQVAATPNNSLCAVGVAFDAQIGGIRMLDGQVSDAVEAKSLSFNPDHIHIYSSSWGPNDDGKTVDGPGKPAHRALQQGIYRG